MLESRLLFSLAAAPLLAAMPLGAGEPLVHAAEPVVAQAAQHVAKAAAAPIVYSGPITITKGGTYTGNWESTDPNVPAVTINTSEPVIIENSNIRSASDGIRCRWGMANLTVRNTNGYGLNPNVAGVSVGRFIDLQFFAKAVIENNYLEGTGGIYFNEYGGKGIDGNTITVRYNIARNIDSRKSDGNGGWQITSGNYKQFVQLNNCHGLPGSEIAWNQIINEAYKSRVEDNISIHLSDGTADKPILIHDNYIQGAYSQDPAKITFSGGGIMLSDGYTDDMTKVGGHVKAYNNQIISTTNYGIAISSGHDNEIYNNRIIMSGKLSDGTAMWAGDAGIYIRNPLNQPTFKNNIAHDNVIGWGRANGGRNDLSLQAATPAAQSTNNTSVQGPITLDTEAAEFELWKSKVAAAGVKLGVQGAAEEPGEPQQPEEPQEPQTNVPLLNSNPGASHTLYLDFDGDTASNTPKYAGSDDDIVEIWKRVSEKYSVFDLNVTTVKPAQLIANQSARVVIGGGAGIGGPGGYATIGGFVFNNATAYSYALNLDNDPRFVGESVAHESGHLFGLDHQHGSGGQEYDTGDMWKAPIMGSSYTALRGTWARGQSNNGTQDDLAVLDSTLGRRDDVHGIIERHDDQDVYTFSTVGGPLHLQITLPPGGMLDTKGQLYDARGNFLGERDRRRLGENADIFLPAGNYTLVVASHGDYGDLGQYFLTGFDAAGGVTFAELDEIPTAPTTPIASAAAPAPGVRIGTIVRVSGEDREADVITVDASEIVGRA